MSSKSLDEPVQDRLRSYIHQCLKSATQGELAERFRVNQSHVSSFINKRSGAGTKLLFGIADAEPETFVKLILGSETDIQDFSGESAASAIAARLLIEDGKGSSASVEAALARAVEVFGEDSASVLAWVRRIEPLLDADASQVVSKGAGKSGETFLARKKQAKG